MRFLLALGAFILSFHLVFSQNGPTVRITGVAVNAETGEPLPFVHIVNINNRSGATTDDKGRFSLTAPKDDTLYFSSVGFKTFFMSFQDSTASVYESLIVRLEPQTVTLQNVEIKAYNLEEILNRPKEKEFTLKKDTPEPLFEPKEKKESPAVGIGVSPGGGAALEGALTAFANLFSAEFKQRKKIRELIAQEQAAAAVAARKQALMDNYKDIARKITGYEKEELDLFLDFSMPDINFLAYAGDYELTLKIYNDYRDFRYKYKLEQVSLEELIENARFKK